MEDLYNRERKIKSNLEAIKKLDLKTYEKVSEFITKLEANSCFKGKIEKYTCFLKALRKFLGKISYASKRDFENLVVKINTSNSVFLTQSTKYLNTTLLFHYNFLHLYTAFFP